MRGADEITVPEPPFVERVNDGDSTLGLVDPEGLIDRARELLTEQRTEGETSSCHIAF